MVETKNAVEEIKAGESVKMDASSGGDKVQNQPSPSKPEDTSTNNNNSSKTKGKTGNNSLTSEFQATIVVDPEVWSFVLAQLARQLEYYLSVQNLSKDTYVQTLRNLNDGCVPVSILANFSKVKNILLSATGIGDEARRTEAVWEAAKEHSSKLRCVNVDTKTGKETSNSDADTNVNTIRAIGTVDNQPIAELEAPPSPLTSPSEQFANAIVLRDVAPEVTPEEIHTLFQFEGCPAVISIVPDVANCWFVQLEATRRSDVMQVLFQIRGETLGGFPVHARIKTSVANSSVAIDAAPVVVPSDWQAGQQQQQQQKSNKNGSKGDQQNKRKQKNQRNKMYKNKKKNGNNNNNSENNNNKSNSGNSQDNERNANNRRDSSNSNSSSGSNKKSTNSSPGSTPSKKKVIAPPPPPLGEEDFPTLVDNRVEWETTPVQDEDKKKEVTSEGSVESKADEEEEVECGIKSVKIGSDSASTATTTSTSTEPGPKKVGYAAALKNKPAGSSTSSIASTVSNNSAAPKAVETATHSSSQNTAAKAQPVDAEPVAVTPPSWGARRSFADILRQAQTAS